MKKALSQSNRRGMKLRYPLYRCAPSFRLLSSNVEARTGTSSISSSTSAFTTQYCVNTQSLTLPRQLPVYARRQIAFYERLLRCDASATFSIDVAGHAKRRQTDERRCAVLLSACFATH